MTDAFANRVALVTGGSRGIGRATALRLAREGADVAISYASRTHDAEQVVAEIQALGRRAICVPCNVAKLEDVTRLVSHTREQLGPIDLLAHCGAISNITDHTGLSYELWLETIDVNLNGAFLVVFAVKDEMIARGFGRMVLVSSVAALRPRKMQIHYASSKAGVIALTRCCAEAFAPHNVPRELRGSRPDRDRDGPRPSRRDDEARRGRHTARANRPARRGRRCDPLPVE